MVYVDELTSCVRSKKWPFNSSCHLIADSRTELYRFALKLTLKRSWMQEGRIPHFDLTTNKRRVAVAMGAIEIDRKTFVRKMNEWPHKKQEFKDEGIL